MKKLITILLLLLLSGCGLPNPPFGAETKLSLADKFNQSQIKNKYQLDGATLKRDVKDNPKDMVRVEIGEKLLGGIGDTTLEPKLTISRWDEVSFSIKPINYDKIAVADKAISFDDDKTIFETPKENYLLYEMPVSEENPEGAFEYEIILKEKPATNKIEFAIENKGLNFYYQPELTQKEKDEGAFRLNNIIGSYAVYASEQKTNYIGDKEYKTGKVGHIFRPKIIDSKGTEVWGNLHIENGILSVTIPQNFLDKAVYPVRHAAGLTFGYETAGGSNVGTVSLIGSEFASGGSGEVTKITAYCYSDGDFFGDSYMRTIILNASEQIITNGISNTIVQATLGWWDFTFSTNPIITSTNYILTWINDGNNLGNQLNYDDGSANQGFTGTTDFSSPSNPTSTSRNTRKYSIYATYTAGGGEETTPAPDNQYNIYYEE